MGLRTPLRSFLFACAGAAVLAGCMIRGGSARPAAWSDLSAEGGWILAAEVPFVPQRSDTDCGVAALASVLALWGVDATFETLERECRPSGSAGIRAADLRGAVRRRGLDAFVFAGTPADLDHEIRRGRPVVVGLVKSVGPLDWTHYEVVVGLRPAGGEVATMDPAVGLVRNSLEAFHAEWSAAGCATLVIFRRSATVAVHGRPSPVPPYRR